MFFLQASIGKLQDLYQRTLLLSDWHLSCSDFYGGTKGGTMLDQKFFHDKWWEIKAGLQNQWAELTDEDIDSNKNNLDAIAEIVFNKTGENREDIQAKIGTLLKSFDNETDKNDFYQSSFERSPLGPGAGATSDIAPGVNGATSHRNYHVRHDGLAEDSESGIDYQANEISKKNRDDFDRDRNARH
jgi:hypothetical protein